MQSSCMAQKLIFIGILFLILLISGCVGTQTQKTGNSGSADAMVKEDSAMKKEGDAMEKKTEEEAMQKESESDAMMEKKSFYLPFTQKEFEEAKAGGKIIFLEFYANWCPICKTQEPEIEKAFSRITQENVAGFRVNYNDSDTDGDEQSLAEQLGITYQHTHVIFNSEGKEIKRSLEMWNSTQVIQELSQAT